MRTVQMRNSGDATEYVLGERVLKNGDEIQIRMRGNRGWSLATIEGLPSALRVRCEAADGKPLLSTLPLRTEVRWPD